MKLYHGSNLIVEKPRLLEPVRTLDFGAGFYTTTNLQQAVDFSLKVVERAKRLKLAPAGMRSVSVYDFDEVKALKDLNVIRFDKPDAAWLEYVFLNRRGVYDGQKYDLMIGPVANDDIYPTLLAYESGVLSAAQTLEALKIKTLYDQYVFASEKALACLKFTKKLLPEGQNG